MWFAPTAANPEDQRWLMEEQRQAEDRARCRKCVLGLVVLVIAVLGVIAYLVFFQKDYKRNLKIINGCGNPIWIAHIGAGASPDPQDLKIEPGQFHEFTTQIGTKGFTAMRFWPKLGCDANGGNCEIGDSGGPEESCVIRGPGMGDDYSKCAPPIDSKFEATFASPEEGRDKDIVDMSLVDGYTLPFKLETSGECMRLGVAFQQMDCSGLSLQACPSPQMIAGVGAVDLRAVNPATGKVGGCYSTCTKLTDDKWGAPMGDPAPYCCRAPFDTPDTCNAGPVINTPYLSVVHNACPEAYGYAYDDVRATIACSAMTMYSVTFFCPIM